MVLTCDHCTLPVTTTAVVVPAMPTGNAHYHAEPDCARAAQVRTGHTWPARIRQRKIQEAMNGSGGSVS